MSTPAETIVVDNTFKCFTGNLPFKVTNEELSEFFSSAGKVVNVTVITRGTRSLGYGFVAYNTEEEANKAAKTLDKAELLGRKINVEAARPNTKEFAADGAKSERGTRTPRGRGRGTPRGNSSRPVGTENSEAPSEVKDGDRSAERAPRGARRGRGRGAGPRNEGDRPARLDDNNENTDDNENRGGSGRGGSRGGFRGGRGSGRGAFRGGFRTPRTEPTGPASTTTIFVANLPFNVTDSDLKDIFKDFKVTGAHVVKRYNGYSRGFGFVEVASETEQKKILNELTGVVVDGRELKIKVAMASQVPHNPEEQK